MTPWYRERRLLASATACGVAVVLLVATLRHAVAAPREMSAAGPTAAGAISETIEQTELPGGLLEETVEHDLFHPERRRPSVAFKLPGDANSATPVAPTSAPAATLRLLGTVVSAGQDAFVMAQLGAEPPHVVRTGGKVGGFTLRKIEPGRAVFISPNGETVDLRVSKSGS
jgi:hypothetical protein